MGGGGGGGAGGAALLPQKDMVRIVSRWRSRGRWSGEYFFLSTPKFDKGGPSDACKKLV